MPNTTYEIAMTRHLQRPSSEAFEIVEHVERFPEFMPNVTSLKLLEVDGNRKVVAWDIMVDDAPLSWIEEGVYDKEHLIVHFRSLEGVFDRFDGYWQVIPEEDRSRVNFELIYEIGLPEIEDIVGPILRERLIENVESMLDALEQRAKRTT